MPFFFDLARSKSPISRETSPAPPGRGFQNAGSYGAAGHLWSRQLQGTSCAAATCTGGEVCLLSHPGSDYGSSVEPSGFGATSSCWVSSRQGTGGWEWLRWWTGRLANHMDLFKGKGTPKFLVLPDITWPLISVYHQFPYWAILLETAMGYSSRRHPIWPIWHCSHGSRRHVGSRRGRWTLAASAASAAGGWDAAVAVALRSAPLAGEPHCGAAGWHQSHQRCWKSELMEWFEW